MAYRSKYSGPEIDARLGKAYLTGATNPTTATSGALGQRYFNTATGKGFICSKVTTVDDVTIFTWDRLLGSELEKFPTIVLGQNNVIRFADDDISTVPKITIQGKSYPNLLGKDGNCEDASKWTAVNATLSLDTANKVFGANGIKIAITSGTAETYKYVPSIDFSKYYMATAYIKNGNATNGVKLRLQANGTGAVTKDTSFMSGTSGFTRTVVKISPADFGSGATQLLLDLITSGSASQYAYVDGVMVNEISSAEYALTDQQLMDKYPYVDSYACLENPYIEVRHDNLVRNGNCEEGIGWWNRFNTTTSLSVDSGRFKIVSTGSSWVRQAVNVKPNTNYHITGNVSGDGLEIRVYSRESTTLLRTNNGTFNSGEATYVTVYAYCANATTGYFDSIMLTEGTTAPSTYKPCRIERCVIEGKFTSDDTVTLESGEVKGLLNWKHRTLFGKDYDWQYSGDTTGLKEIVLAAGAPGAVSTINNDTSKLIKYDGVMLKQVNPAYTNYDQYDITYATKNLYVEVKDTDSGWAETILPNADEVKAFMNGWKAIGYSGSRYISYISIVDGSVPSGGISAVTSTVGANAVITLSSGVGTNFVNGDRVTIIRNKVNVGSLVVSSSTASTVTFSSPATWVSGDTILREDNGTTNISLLTYCKNNIALGYEGYQLHYKLENPEPITDVNVHIHGDIPKLDNGDNYLYLDYGVVLGEIAGQYVSNSTNYINAFSGDNPSNNSLLRKRCELILAVYKNGAVDAWAWSSSFIALRGNGYSSTPSANYDVNATYTVDYQILRTLIASPASISMSYQQDVLNAVADLAEVMGSKQNRDSALDDMVDSSVYEKINGFSAWGRFYSPTQLNMLVLVPMVPKKCKPTVTIDNVTMAYVASDGNIYYDIPRSDITVGVNPAHKGILRLAIGYSGTNAAIKTNLLNYGGAIGCNITLDCRGKV